MWRRERSCIFPHCCGIIAVRLQAHRKLADYIQGDRSVAEEPPCALV